MGGSGPNDVYSFGLKGPRRETLISYGRLGYWEYTLFHYNGDHWEEVSVDVANVLWAGCCASDGTVFLAGAGGTILRRDAAHSGWWGRWRNALTGQD